MEKEDIEEDVSDFVYGLSGDDVKSEEEEERIEEKKKKKKEEEKDNTEVDEERELKSEENIIRETSPKTEEEKVEEEVQNEFIQALLNLHRLVNLSNATKTLEEQTPKDDEKVEEELQLLNKRAGIVSNSLDEYKEDVNKWLDIEVRRSTELWDKQTKKDNEEKLPMMNELVAVVHKDVGTREQEQYTVEDKYVKWRDEKEVETNKGVDEEVEVRKKDIEELQKTKERAEDELKETRKEREEREKNSKERKDGLEKEVKEKRDENDKYLDERFKDGKELMESILEYMTDKNKEMLIYLNDVMLRRTAVLGMTEKKGFYDEADVSAAQEAHAKEEETEEEVVRSLNSEDEVLDAEGDNLVIVKALLSGVVESSALGRYKITKDDRQKLKFKVGKDLLEFEQRLYLLGKEMKKNKELLEEKQKQLEEEGGKSKLIPGISRSHSFLLLHPESLTDVVKQTVPRGDDFKQESEVLSQSAVENNDNTNEQAPAPPSERPKNPLITSFEPPVPLVPIGSALLSYLLQQELLINEAVEQSGAMVTETAEVLVEMNKRLEKLLEDLKEIHEKRENIEKKITSLRGDGEEVAAAMLDVQDREGDENSGGSFVNTVINRINDTCDFIDSQNQETKKIYLEIIELQEKQNKAENDLTNRIEKEVLQGLKKSNEEEVRTMTQAEARADTLLFRVNERLDVVERSILKSLDDTVLDVIKYGDKETIRKRENQKNRRERRERKKARRLQKEQKEDGGLFIVEDTKKEEKEEELSESDDDDLGVQETEANLDAIIKQHNRDAYHNADDEKKMEELIVRLGVLKKHLEEARADQDANEGKIVKEMETKCSAAQQDLERHEHDYQENNDVKFSLKESLVDVIKSINEFNQELKKYRIISQKKVEDLVEVHVREELNSNEFVFGRLLEILQRQYDQLADAEDREAGRLDEHLNRLTIQVEEMEVKIVKQRELVREKAEALAASHDSHCGIIDARLQYVVEVYKRTHKKLVNIQQLVKNWKKSLEDVAHLSVKENEQGAREQLARGDPKE